MENEINEKDGPIQEDNTQLVTGGDENVTVFRRHIKDNPEKALLKSTQFS